MYKNVIKGENIMLCSDCKKNNAVVFINKKDNDGKNTLEGYCYDCAKKEVLILLIV